MFYSPSTFEDDVKPSRFYKNEQTISENSFFSNKNLRRTQNLKPKVYKVYI